MLDDSARRALGSTRFTDVRWYPEVGSTNAVLAELARAGAPEGVVVVADHQTAGRGRLGRAWEAEPGTSLLMSVLLRPHLAPAHVPLLTFLMAMAASDACQEVAGVTPLLKWPNDLTVEDAKLGGVLGETVSGGNGIAVVIGLGLNVKDGPALPAAGVALEALAGESGHSGRPLRSGHPGRSADRSSLLVALLSHLDARYGDLQRPGGPARLLDGYRARSATLGRVVRVELATSSLEGEAVDVTPEGHLLVDAAEAQHVVRTGDVVHLRAALTARSQAPVMGRAMSPPAGGRPAKPAP